MVSFLSSSPSSPLIPRVILGFTGTMLSVLGTWRVISPSSFFDQNAGIPNIDPNDVSLINELRGMGSVPVGFGLVMLALGVLFPTKESTTTALICSNTLLASFLVTRCLSALTDGMPNEIIQQGMMGELFLLCLNAFAFSTHLKSGIKKD